MSKVFSHQIQVVNKNSPRGLRSTRFYIGRPSVLGNPFVVGKHGDRNQVIEKYRHWLYAEIKRKGEAFDMLIRILNQYENDERNIELVCWCAPLACHGEVIRNAILWLSKT